MATLNVSIRCVRVPTDDGNKDLYFTQLNQMNSLAKFVAQTKEDKAVQAALKSLNDESYKSALLAALAIEEDAYTEALATATTENSYDGLVTFFLTLIPDKDQLVAFFKMAKSTLHSKNRSHLACFRFLFADIVTKTTGAEGDAKDTVAPFNYENVAAAAQESTVIPRGSRSNEFLKTLKWINTATVLRKSVTADALATLSGDNDKKVKWAAYLLPSVTAALGLPSIGDIPERPEGSPLEGIETSKKAAPKNGKPKKKGKKAKKVKADDAKPADADAAAEDDAEDDASEAGTEAAAPEAEAAGDDNDSDEDGSEDDDDEEAE